MTSASRHHVGAVGEFPMGEMRTFNLAGKSVGLVRTPEAFYAMLNYCPHHGAPVCQGHFGGTMLPSSPDEFEFGMENRVIRCPWHLWEFDVATGKCLFGVSDMKILTYNVEIEEDQVYVNLSRRRSDTKA
jgi:nitrite reductase (NADH) small subunit